MKITRTSIRTGLLAGSLAAFTLTGALAQTATPVLTNLWKITSDSGADGLATTGDLNRGVALNPVNGNVLYTTRSGGNTVVVVDPNGAVQGRLLGTGIGEGTFLLLGVRVTDDGVVYAANLAQAAGSVSSRTLKIYRWPSDMIDGVTPPQLVFLNTNCPARYGDAMDIRGTGTNTQIIMVGSAGNKLAWFTTTDGTNFNNFSSDFATYTNFGTFTEIAYPAGVPANELGKGIAFDGTNNVFFAKSSANATLRQVSFNPTALTSSVLMSFTTDAKLVGLGVLRTNGATVAAGVIYGGTIMDAANHRAKVWDLTITNDPIPALDEPMPGPFVNNGNGIGAADARAGRIVLLEPNCGLALYSVSTATVPPTIATQPASNTNILNGGFYTLSAAASGTRPFSYQWQLANGDLLGRTNRNLALTNFSGTDAGDYTLVVTNSYGSVTSNPARLGVIPSVRTLVATQLWALAPGSRTYLTTADTQRGLAYNPLTGNLLLASRSPSNTVCVLSAATGAHVAVLNMSRLTNGGTYTVNMVGAADDGAIYACNLVLTGGTNFTLYRWANENPATLATMAFADTGTLNVGRLGDTLAVRGAGTNTEIIVASRDQNAVVLFTTTDGLTFTPAYTMYVDAPVTSGNGFAGLGLCWGPTNTFYGKTGSYRLRQVAFDPVYYSTNGIINTYDTDSALYLNIGVDSVNSLLAGIASGDTPSNLRLYDLAGLQPPCIQPLLVDQDFFLSDNANGNGTGAVAFDPPNKRLFALDSNNGILALGYNRTLITTAAPLRISGERVGDDYIVTWCGVGVLQSAPAADGPWTTLVDAPNPYTSSIPATGTTLFRVLR